MLNFANLIFFIGDKKMSWNYNSFVFICLRSFTFQFQRISLFCCSFLIEREGLEVDATFRDGDASMVR